MKLEVSEAIDEEKHLTVHLYQHEYHTSIKSPLKSLRVGPPCRSKTSRSIIEVMHVRGCGQPRA